MALGLKCVRSVAVMHGLSCPSTCGIFLEQQLNWCPLLHWQAGSQPLDHQGSPDTTLFLKNLYLFIFGCAESLLLRTGYSLVAMPMLLIVVTSLNTEQGL